ncbi:MAG: hypothetical protein WCJ09_27160, partial [Planctomycetota bacterium]
SWKRHAYRPEENWNVVFGCSVGGVAGVAGDAPRFGEVPDQTLCISGASANPLHPPLGAKSDVRI